MKKTPLRKGLTVDTSDGLYVIRHVDRNMTPPLIMLTKKHKGMHGRKIYVRANALECSIN